MSATANARPLRPGEHLSTCRSCGTWGIETPDDPAPGICPVCLEQRMAALVPRLETQVARRGQRAALDWLYRRLRDAGFLPPWAAAQCLFQAEACGLDWEPPT